MLKLAKALVVTILLGSLFFVGAAPAASASNISILRFDTMVGIPSTLTGVQSQAPLPASVPPVRGPLLAISHPASQVNETVYALYPTSSGTGIGWDLFRTTDGGGNGRIFVDANGNALLDLNRGNADQDIRHSFVFSSLYELPFGKGKKYATGGVASALAGGWQLNPNVALYSGTPFIVSADGSSLNAPNNTQVADQISSTVQKFGGVGLGAPFYDPSAFAPVRDVRFGNMGLNALRGPRPAARELQE